MPNLIPIFLTGLLTGGLTCLAVQGGLLAATIAQNEQQKLEQDLKQNGHAVPILFFLISKLIAYTLLGFLLGYLGSFFKLSTTAQIILQSAVIIFMVGTALNLLNVHPIFRYFVISPPRFLTRIIRNQSKSKDFFAPVLLGALTILIPCGTTQAMLALAVSSGNSLAGGLILFSFILGTSPIFFILGYFATKLGDSMHKNFMKFAALTIILLAVFNLNNTLVLATGNSFGDFGNKLWCSITWCTQENGVVAGTNSPTNETTIEIGPGGYTPNNITVNAGSNVVLKLKNDGGGGCASAFSIPKLGIQKVVTIGNTESVSFVAPKEKGQIQFMCSMGMYRGIINVI